MEDNRVPSFTPASQEVHDILQKWVAINVPGLSTHDEKRVVGLILFHAESVIRFEQDPWRDWKGPMPCV